MEIIDILGHLFYIFLVGGTILVARKKAVGFLLRASGGAGWLVLGIIMGYTSIWFWSAVFTCIDLYGWWKWKYASAIS